MTRVTSAGKLLQWIVLLALAVIWGSSFILMKRGLEHFSPSVVASLRISITFICLLPFVIRRIRSITWKQFLLLTLAGLMGNGLPAFLFAFAQTGIDSSVSGILNSLTPLFTLTIGLLLFKIKTSPLKLAGVVIGLTGAIGLLSISGRGDMIFNFSYGVWAILATFFYALNLNFIKTYIRDIDAVTLTSFSFLPIGAVSASYLLFFSDFPLNMHQAGATEGLLYVAVLAVAGTAFAMILFNWLLSKTSAIVSSTVTYMIPVVALFWGITDGEAFSAGFLIWIFLILFGVYLVNKN